MAEITEFPITTTLLSGVDTATSVDYVLGVDDTGVVKMPVNSKTVLCSTAIAQGGSVTLSETSENFKYLELVTGNVNNDTSTRCYTLIPTPISGSTVLSFTPIMYGATASYIRFQLNGTSFQYLTSNSSSIYIHSIIGVR